MCDRNDAFVAILALLLLFTPSALARTIKVREDVIAIRDAVAIAEPGDTVVVASGVYNENVLINKPIKLVAADLSDKPIIDGNVTGGANLLGAGIHIAFASDVVVKGFIVQNFERGILLEHASSSIIEDNETRFNAAKADTATLSSGITLINSRFNVVRNNDSHHNQHDGIFLSSDSSFNTISNNILHDNGPSPAPLVPCGITIAGGSSGNIVRGNELFRNARGLQVVGNSVGNMIQNNNAHDNSQHGLAAFQPSSRNIFANNIAINNGEFDLWDQPPTNNVWRENAHGRRNFR